jgi:hypothetical protein
MTSKRSRWRARAAWSAVALAVVVVVVLSVRNLHRLNSLVEWRRSLQFGSVNTSWPSWRSQWPPLPAPRERDVLLGDLRGPYAFAAQHSDALQHIPCYCGCVRIGHRSNLDCYITRFLPDATPVWTDHAFT